MNDLLLKLTDWQTQTISMTDYLNEKNLFCRKTLQKEYNNKLKQNNKNP